MLYVHSDYLLQRVCEMDWEVGSEEVMFDDVKRAAKAGR